MQAFNELSYSELVSLGVGVAELCRRIEATLPDHGPKRLAGSVRFVTETTLEYLKQLIEEEKKSGSRLYHLNFFSRSFRRVHQELFPLLSQPDPFSFPSELLLPLKGVLSKYIKDPNRNLSFCLISRPEYNLLVHLIESLAARELGLIESSYTLARSAKVGKFIRKEPTLFVVMTLPTAESRNVFSAALLLHEIAHGIDSMTHISDAVIDSGKIGLPSGSSTLVPVLISNWVHEFIADLIATRLFGPVVLFALRRLSILVENRDSYSKTHPSCALRMLQVLDHLEGMGFLEADRTCVSKHLSSWREECKNGLQEPPDLDHRMARDALLAPEAIRQIHDVVAQRFADETLSAEQYASGVRQAKETMMDGVPPLVEGSAREILAIAFGSAWEIALLHEDRPLNFLNYSVAEDVRGKAMEAIHSLTLKAIEASYATKIWKRQPRTARPPRPPVEPSLAAALCETEIRKLIAGGTLRIVPLLEESQISRASVDIRLGSHFIVTKAGSVTHFSSSELDHQTICGLEDPVSKGLGREFVLHPNRLVLGATLEYLCLPEDISALVLSRSCYGRLGLVVATAAFVHPGWRGCLTLELANYSEVPIKLRCGEPVAQLVLIRTGKIPSSLLASSRAGLCPIRPLFPEFHSSRQDAEWRNLDRFRNMVNQT